MSVINTNNLIFLFYCSRMQYALMLHKMMYRVSETLPLGESPMKMAGRETYSLPATKPHALLVISQIRIAFIHPSPQVPVSVTLAFRSHAVTAWQYLSGRHRYLRGRSRMTSGPKSIGSVGTTPVFPPRNPNPHGTCFRPCRDCPGSIRLSSYRALQGAS